MVRQHPVVGFDGLGPPSLIYLLREGLRLLWLNPLSYPRFVLSSFGTIHKAIVKVKGVDPSLRHHPVVPYAWRRPACCPAASHLFESGSVEASAYRFVGCSPP